MLLPRLTSLLTLGVLGQASAFAAELPPMSPLTLWFTQAAQTGAPDGGPAAILSNFGVPSKDAPDAKPPKTTDPIYRVTKGPGTGIGSLYMNEAVPIGNGQLGALVFGGTALERLVLNEISLWSGDENPGGTYATMGNYETLGNLWLQLPGHAAATGYRRQLDLDQALASVFYTVGDVHYTRELIASAPAGVIAFRLTASKPGSLTGKLAWQDAHQAPATLEADHLLAVGKLPNGLRFATGITVVPLEGQVTRGAEGIAFTNCDSLLVLAASATDYAMDHARGYRDGLDPAATVRDRLTAAAAQSWSTLKAVQLADHQKYFRRVGLQLGASSPDQRALPTDLRRNQVAAGDPEFDALLFNFGRYLLISCSRPGSLPANLQGLWNDINNPPWHSDYHTNINVQMNYWPAESANLSELHTPLFDLILSQLEHWRKATAASPDFKPTVDNAPGVGWAVRTSHNTMGGGGWKWDKTANVWYAHHFWEHYAFNRDIAWLRATAWPLMRELAEFWIARLKTLPDGKLVVPKGWSPEHGPTEDGVAYSQQKIWNHFTNCLDALAVLGGEDDLRQRLVSARDRLAAPAIGSWGQLLEWSTEKARPVFTPDARWEKSGEAVVIRFISDAQKNPASAQAFVWSRLGEENTRRLTAKPKDFAALADGLNALVAGPALITEPALAKATTPSLLQLHALKSTLPAIQRWLNWCLLVRAADLTSVINTEDTPLNTHRHTSHLFAVYPGRQISPALTPELAEAARVSLLGRGDQGNVTEWAFAWRASLFARLRDGENAHRQIARFFGTTCPNLFGNHPPMQIDGNFGITAGIAEMLLQSHAGTLDLLPALPAAWPTGSVTGLRARGDIAVDLTWATGRLTEASFLSARDARVTVALGDLRVDLVLPAGTPVRWSPPDTVKPAVTR